jgi:hypothetical protein
LGEAVVIINKLMVSIAYPVMWNRLAGNIRLIMWPKARVSTVALRDYAEA